MYMHLKGSLIVFNKYSAYSVECIEELAMDGENIQLTIINISVIYTGVYRTLCL